MKKLVSVLLILGLSLPLAAVESLEAVEAAIKSAWEKHQSLSADVELSATIPMGEAQLPLSGGGTLEYLKSGEKTMYRQVLSAKMPEPMTLGGSVDALFDGDDLYLTTEFLGKVETKKELPALTKGAVPPGGNDLIKAIQGDFDIAVKDEKSIDGAACFSLECTPKAGKDIPIKKTLIAIEKASGVMRSVEIIDASDAVLATITTKNVKLNPTLNPGRFVYQAPEKKEAEAPKE